MGMHQSPPGVPGSVAAPPAVGLNPFLKSVADLGLMDADALKKLVATLPPAPRQHSPAVAQQLSRRKVLSRFQATQLLAGYGQALLVGNYVVVDKLGAGGMGVVYKAQHRMLGRVVALKVLAPEIVNSPNAVRRFK